MIGERLSLLPLVVLLQVSLLLSRELTQSVNDFAVVVLTAAHILGGTHDGDVGLTATGANMVPVDEVDVSEFATIQLAVLNGHGLAAAEEAGTQVAIGVHGGEVTGLVNIAAELSVNGAGVTVVALVDIVGDQTAHDVQQVVLQVLQVEGVEVMRALLDHDGAGGMVRNDAHSAVDDAGLGNDLHDVGGDVMEGGDPTAGLQLNFFLNNFKFHCVFPPICNIYY